MNNRPFPATRRLMDPQSASGDELDDEFPLNLDSSDALPLIDALVRRHDETGVRVNRGYGQPSLAAALTRPRYTLSSHFLEHCGVAARSGLGALFCGLLHILFTGDFSFLAAVVASVCVAPTVGSTLSKASHAFMAALLCVPLALAALLAGAAIVPRSRG